MRLEEREETGAGGDGFRFGGRRHGHGHPLRRKKKKAESFAEVEEGGHQKTTEAKGDVCMQKAGTERFRNRFCCQRAQRLCTPYWSATPFAVSTFLPSFRSVGICILIDYGAE